MSRNRHPILRLIVAFTITLPPLSFGRLAAADAAWTELDEQRIEHERGILNGAISPDGKMVASTCVAQVRLWVVSGKEP